MNISSYFREYARITLAVIKTPRKFFEEIKNEGKGYLKPFAYMLISESVLLLGFLLGLLFRQGYLTALPLIDLYIFLAQWSIVYIALLQLATILVRGKGKLNQTFKVICYSFSPLNFGALFAIAVNVAIPTNLNLYSLTRYLLIILLIVCLLSSVLYMFYIVVVGISITSEISGSRAFAALMIQLFIFALIPTILAYAPAFFHQYGTSIPPAYSPTHNPQNPEKYRITAYANNSPLDSYIQNLTSAGADYASGQIGPEELACKGIETEYLIWRDNLVIYNFFSLRYEFEIKKMYEVTFDKSDRRYEDIDVSNSDMNDERVVKKRVLESVIYSMNEPKHIVVYYNLQDEKPIAIYLIILKDRYTKYFAVDMYPVPYEQFLNDREFREKCLEAYPKSALAIEYLTQPPIQPIVPVKTERSEPAIVEDYPAKSNDSYGKRDDAYLQWRAQWESEAEKAIKQINNYRSLSDGEKIKLVQEKFQEEFSDRFPSDKTNTWMTMSENDMEIASLGSNLQFNVFLVNESNSMFSETIVFDINNKTKTIHQNRLVSGYDFYIGTDATLLYELALMEDVGEGVLSFGKRVIIGLLNDEIRIKPFQKIYKIFSIQKFIRGVTSKIS